MITDTSQKDEFIEQMGWEDRQADIEDVPRSTMITDTSQKDEFIEQMGWEDRQADIEDVPRSTMITDTSQMDEFIEQMIHNDDDDGDFEDDDDKNDEYVPDSCDSDSEDDEIDQFESTDRPSSKRRIRTYPNLMQRYKKPARKCPYCSKYYVEKLTRHITTVHKDMKAVIEAMELPKKERDRAFDLMRKEGILLANKQIMKSSTTTEYQRERNTGNDDPLVMCAICKGFFSSRFFSRHKLRCQGDSCLESCPVPVSLMVSEPDTQINLTEFKKEILCKFRHDDVGETCRNDPTIVTIGKRLWDKGKAKENKKTEVRKSVMSDMRRLASLYKCFKEQSKIHSTFEVEESGTSQDMFRRRSFNVLIEAIHSYTSNEGKAGVKSGLKLGLYYLLKKASKVIKATHLMEEKDSEASEIDKFISVLELNYNFVFGDAMYQININRQKNLRKPAALPVEDDVHKLRNYTLDAMASMVNDEYAVWDSHRFSKLRNLTVSRLTLFNARRGGEPSRMSLEEWQQASSNAWIDKQKASLISDPLEKHLLNDLKITYQAGKGNNHLVPILFPADCIAAMELLTCKEVRATAGVKAENQYVFACTQTSSNHVSGWHAMNGICDDANVVNKSNLTATKNRHRISTIYASFDLPENERTLFFKHMGHSAEINENIYQAPAAVMEVTRVGKQLQHIDNNQHMREELWNDHDESSSNEDQHMREELWNDHDESSSSEGKKRKYKGSSSDKRNSKNEQKSKLGRPYTKWGKKDATKVAKYFNDIITGQSCKTIPGRADVEVFLKKHKLEASYSWITIRTKVMNERVKHLQKAQE
ncbi:hypothetical protein HOLleu_05024 [Holothuria leucospilota]|uniref:Uncharacterized protein n=1 Tax=Holothuria leucospilota TaxID=206669 RepID=A0A9Q1CKT1_HOLLE|nr:hypothetical protein HOLleu_05024 [Holothuria leucospilota]